jgi:hypothetical protein
MNARRAELLTGEWRVDAAMHPRAIPVGTPIHITEMHHRDGSMTATRAL